MNTQVSHSWVGDPIPNCNNQWQYTPYMPTFPSPYYPYPSQPGPVPQPYTTPAPSFYNNDELIRIRVLLEQIKDILTKG